MPRVRTQGSYKAYTGKPLVTRCNNTQDYGTIVSIPEANGSVKTTIDEPTPGFYTKMKNGEVVNTPFQTTTISKSFQPGASWSYFYQKDPIFCKMCESNDGTTLKIVTGTNPWPGMYENARTGSIPADYQVALGQMQKLAVTDAFANIAKPDVLAAVDIAEMAQTLRMMRNPIAGLDKIFRHFERMAKQRDLRNLTQAAVSKGLQKSAAKKLARLQAADKTRTPYGALDFMRDNWLQVRYGVMPLIGSLQGLYKSLTQRRRPLRQTARGFASNMPTPTNWTEKKKQSLGPYGWNVEYRKTLEASYSVRAGVLYEYTWNMQRSLGLDLAAVPVTAWELVPFSFVADWFGNFGSWIEAVTPKAGVKVLTSWQVTREKIIFTCDVTGSAFNDSGCMVATGCPGLTLSEVKESVVRIPGVSPSFSSRLNTIDLGKSVWQKRVVDAFALVHGRISRKR